MTGDEFDRQALACEAEDIVTRAERGGLAYGDLARLDFLRRMGVPVRDPDAWQDTERPAWLWKLVGHDPTARPQTLA